MNVALGLWVIVSPWTIVHIMAGTNISGGVTEIVMWNHYVIGLAVAIIAAVAAYTWSTSLEWTNIFLGSWLLVSPLVLGYRTPTALMLTWNAVSAGVFILFFAFWSLAKERGSKQSPEKR